MPSSPKIPKEMILKAALDLLIRDGYVALNIKALAKELSCSTQPISWHFGNMDGLRKELAQYALDYANQKLLSVTNDAMNTFFNIGTAYIDIAFDEPNLFRYLFMNGGSGFCVGEMDVLTKTGENAVVVEWIAQQLNISSNDVSIYVRDMMIYTHGLASFIASGLIQTEREQIKEMIKSVSCSFLAQMGG